MKKAKKQYLFSKYIKLANPNWWLTALLLFTSIGYYVLKAIDVVFAARVTVGLYTGINTGNFTDAYVNLLIQFSLMILRQAFDFANYWAYNLQYGPIFNNVQNKIIKKLLNANATNFEKTSREKILNIIQNDVNTIANYIDELSKRISLLIQAVVSVAVVWRANVYVALALLGLCIINILVLRSVNNWMARGTKAKSEAKDIQMTIAQQIMSDKDVINEFNSQDEYLNKYSASCDDWCRAASKYYYAKGFKDSWFYAIWGGGAMLLTALMIFFVSNRTIPLELYLIVVPYFLTVAENMNNVFEITLARSELKVSLNRVQTILDFTDEQLTRFGNINSAELQGNVWEGDRQSLSLIAVSYNNDTKYSPYIGKLNDVDLTFANDSVNCIIGGKRCGKRLIFNMLRRKISPDHGVVLLNNINILEYSSKNFKEEIYYCVSSPAFTTGTIMENLMSVCHNKEKVFACCKMLDIFDEIADLPDGFDHKIDDLLSRGLKFMLGLARCYLTDCKTLMIYELPNSITNHDYNRIIRAIHNISLTKSVIFFTHDPKYKVMAKVSYFIDNGTIVDTYIHDDISISTLLMPESKEESTIDA